MAKRLLDILVSVAVLAIFAPLMLIIACAIKVTSRGAVIFRQKRMGYQKKPFTIFKFRTMLNGSGKQGDLVLKGDKRVTAVGKYLRTTHLDELPQFWNVLKGDMSLVGPRPLSLELVRLRTKKYPDYGKRFEVKPGITGPSQLRGRMWVISNMEASMKLDILYSRQHSFLEDLRILGLTIPVLFGRKGV